MKRRFDELQDLRIEISEAGRARHMAAIEDALRAAPARTASRVWSRRVAFAAVALAVLVPAAAIAAEGTVPGDLLYPVKRVVEPVRMLFDEEVAARHRVEELESLVEAEADARVIDRQVEEAGSALAEVDAPRLQRRYDGLVDRIRERHRSDQPVGESDRPVDESEEPVDRTTTTTEQNRSPGTDEGGDHNRDRNRNTTTTASHDRPSDRPRDGD